MPGTVLHELFITLVARERRDEYFGTLVNAFLEKSGEARAIFAGQAYVDVGTIHGYREAMKLLGTRPDEPFAGLVEHHLKMKGVARLRRPRPYAGLRTVSNRPNSNL